MGEPIKICVVMEGGLIQQVLSAGVPVEVVVIDYDTEGADQSELASIPQGDGSEVAAFIRVSYVEKCGPFVERAFEIAEAQHEEG